MSPRTTAKLEIAAMLDRPDPHPFDKQHSSKRIRNKQSFVFMVAIVTLIVGCSRTKYRLHADKDAYDVLHQKSAHTPWLPESNFSVYPAAHSRLHQHGAVDDPQLPNPTPQLYAYQLPDLPNRDPARFRPHDSDDRELKVDELPANLPAELPSPLRELEQPKPRADNSLRRIPPIHPDSEPTTAQHSNNVQIAYQVESSTVPQETRNSTDVHSTEHEDTNPNVVTGGPADDETTQFLQGLRSSAGLTRRQVPIPQEYWKIPPECRKRMLEFDSLIREYRDTFKKDPDESILDGSPRLALEDIIELTLLNSRELQTEKETLYRAALRLTLERFAFQLKPSVGGNGIDSNFVHNRTGGITSNTLSIPSSLQLDKMLWTGGDLLSRFANSVVLEFNGASGFSSSVASDLFLQISQSIFQRDILLESLTQAERDVVYAARDYMRFRKELFVQLANQYYSLILQFRQVEIDGQNYFTLVRNFNQRQAELRGGFSSRIQVDQIEQQVISGRQSLLSTCTNLENSLDRLKLQIGLPTEMELNLDLTELNLLTLRDELAVNTELARRVRNRLVSERNAELPSRATLLTGSAVLMDRILDSLQLRTSLGEVAPDKVTFEIQKALLQLEAARINVEDARRELNAELRDDSPSASVIIQRRIDMIDGMLKLVELQILLGNLMRLDGFEGRPQEYGEISRESDSLVNQFVQLIEKNQLSGLEALIQKTEILEVRLSRLVRELDQALNLQQKQKTSDELLRETEEQVENLMRESEALLDSSTGGLVPVEIPMDDAMMTALVQRFDLINERGAVADNWRQIKYAADNLKSILNISASQSVGTRAGLNRPFDFTFDESTTSLSATFDAPLNRRAERNSFRSSLFNYQASLRSLTQLEDSIKIDIRRDLRTLSLSREQYVNDIASAALASERVESTELEFELSVGNVSARDFLESQTAYTRALSGVASRHIDYIRGRLQLFLDLETLTVGDDGFWHGLYDETLQPESYHQLPPYALPPFDHLHPCPLYSPKILRMLHAPVGTAMIHRYNEDRVDMDSVEPMLEAAEALLEAEVAPELFESIPDAK